jgi:hypothetical protein
LLFFALLLFLLEVEADTFVTLPAGAADAFDLPPFATGSDTFTTEAECPRPFVLSLCASRFEPPTRVPIF